MTRVIGLDIHRVFAEAVMLDVGKIVPLGKIGMTRQHLRAFAHTLTHDDHVVIEATGNAAAVNEVLAPHVWASGDRQSAPGAADRRSAHQDRYD
jgi:transposase